MEREKLIRLVQGAQSGKMEAMDALFTEFYNDVYYFALKTVKNEDIACDITQETFMQVIQSIGNLKEPAAFVSWLRQITYHYCTRHFSKKTEVLVEEDEDGNTVFDTLADESEGSISAQVLEQEEFRQTILKMINELSEEQRAAVMLYYFDELSVGQIAQIQGVSEGTVKSRLNYARKAIKKSVESYEKKHDIKLHSFALLPLLLLLLGKEKMPEAKAAQVRRTVMASAKASAATAGAATGAAKAGAGVASKLSLITKIAAGVVAASLVAGTVAVVNYVKNNKEDDDRDKEKVVDRETMFPEDIREEESQPEEFTGYTEPEYITIPETYPEEIIPEIYPEETGLTTRNPHLVIASTEKHAIAIRDDGTALYKAYYEPGDREGVYYEEIATQVAQWTDLIAVDVGNNHAVGLKSDGTVVAAGYLFNRQCYVEEWTDVTAIAAGVDFTVGIQSGYRIEIAGSTYRLGNLSYFRPNFVAMSGGMNASLNCDGCVSIWRSYKDEMDDMVAQWENAVQVSSRGRFVAALFKDGTVKIAQKATNVNTDSWTEIQQIATGNNHAIGLQADGTVVASGDNTYGQCDVSHWTDIVAVYAGADHSIGLRADGTVVTAGQIDLSDWSNIYIPTLDIP